MICRPCGHPFKGTKGFHARKRRGIVRPRNIAIKSACTLRGLILAGRHQKVDLSQAPCRGPGNTRPDFLTGTHACTAAATTRMASTAATRVASTSATVRRAVATTATSARVAASEASGAAARRPVVGA
jgi:hypothetical protein